MFAYCCSNPVVSSDPYGYCGCGATSIDKNFNFAYACPGCGGAGYGGGGGILIALGEVATWAIEGAAKIATWTFTASTYAYAQTFVDTTADRFADQQPRVHHIIPKGKFSWYGSQIMGMMDEMHEMLEKADIGINDAENLIIVSHGSHKTMHTKGYIIQIYNIMKQAENGGREAVLEALDYARNYVASLDKYANGW